MLSTLFLASASASFAVSAGLYTSSDGGCGGDRVMHFALELDICKLAPEACELVPECDELNGMISQLAAYDPNLAGKLPQFGECFSLATVMELFPKEPTPAPTSLRRLMETRAEAKVLEQIRSFLGDVVAPVARRRQNIPGMDMIPSMDNLPFGDIKLECGGASIGTMSAGASAGITVAVMLLIFGIAAAVLFFGYRVRGFKTEAKADEEEGEQGVEMHSSTTPKGPEGETQSGQWISTA